MHNRKPQKPNPWTLLNPTPLSETMKKTGRSLGIAAGISYLYFSPKQPKPSITNAALLLLTFGVIGASLGFFSGKMIDDQKKKARKMRLRY